MGISARMLRALGWCWIIVGGAALPFILIAAADGAAEPARGFAETSCMGMFAGGLVLMATRGLAGAARAPSALRLALIAWLTTPIIAAPPLIAAADGNVMAGLFESYSALTTTGATVLVPEMQSDAVILWRSVLQWLGGFASVVLAVTVFAALEDPGMALRRTALLTVQDENLFTNFGPASRRLGSVYALITLSGLLALTLAGESFTDAFALSLSAVSTGGMSPWSGPLGDHVSTTSIVIVAVLCGLGAWNMAMQYELLNRRRSGRLTGDLRAMGGLCLATAALMILVNGPLAAPAAFADALFAITTAGYTATGGAAIPAVFLLSLALIGGSAVSTSGGLKITRLILLLSRARAELALLAHPSAPVHTTFAGRTVPDAALLGVWLYALAFPVVLGLAALLLGLAGTGFDEAWRAAAATLSNAGPLAQVDYAALTPSAQLICILVMVTGRLEILAAAAAVFVILRRE